jgi:TrmH RNA methyltransferase
MKANEQKIYGRNACLAFARKSPDNVIRAYCNDTVQGEFGFLLKHLAKHKRAYHIVTNDALGKLSESLHHEGVMLLVNKPPIADENILFAALDQESKQKTECLLCLDGLSNPHNLGSIVRTAAHFGVQRIVLFNVSDDSLKSLLSAAYHRTAEGGAVHVDIIRCKNSEKFIEKISEKYGFTLAATSSHSAAAFLHRTTLPKRLALLMGSEGNGVSPDLLKRAQFKICINGTGHVESLNVASATAILLNEYARQTQNCELSPVPIKPTFAERVVGRKRKGS